MKVKANKNIEFPYSTTIKKDSVFEVFSQTSNNESSIYKDIEGRIIHSDSVTVIEESNTIISLYKEFLDSLDSAECTAIQKSIIKSKIKEIYKKFQIDILEE